RLWESGIMGPAVMPCSTRRNTSDPRFGARPQSSENSANSEVAQMKRRTSPKLRASQPVRGTAMASVTVKEVMTQVPWLGLMARSPAMVGMATLAMDVSRMFMNTASDTPSVSNASLMPVMGGYLPVTAHHRGGHAGQHWVLAAAVGADDVRDQLLGAAHALGVDRRRILGRRHRGERRAVAAGVGVHAHFHGEAQAQGMLHELGLVDPHPHRHPLHHL